VAISDNIIDRPSYRFLKEKVKRKRRYIKKTGIFFARRKSKSMNKHFKQIYFNYLKTRFIGSGKKRYKRLRGTSKMYKSYRKSIRPVVYLQKFLAKPINKKRAALKVLKLRLSLKKKSNKRAKKKLARAKRMLVLKASKLKYKNLLMRHQNYKKLLIINKTKTYTRSLLKKRQFRRLSRRVNNISFYSLYNRFPFTYPYLFRQKRI
jgi:hypothetical protein